MSAARDSTVEYTAPALSVDSASAPVGDYIAPAPAVYAAGPIGEYTSLAPGGNAAPVPMRVYMAPVENIACSSSGRRTCTSQ